MTMTQSAPRGHALATRLEEATDTLITLVEPCSEAQWRADAPNEARLPLFGGQPCSAQLIVEMVLIGHIEGYPHSHLPTIRAALAV
jgi:hypothetical protein